MDLIPFPTRFDQQGRKAAGLVVVIEVYAGSGRECGWRRYSAILEKLGMVVPDEEGRLCRVAEVNAVFGFSEGQ